MPVTRVAIVGTGVIGASWASNFLAQGLDVTAYDPAPGAEAALHRTVAAHWPIMQAMGLQAGADPGRLRFHATLPAALDGAEFVQENGPERLEAKQALFTAMDAATPPEAIIASSSSTLKISNVQGGCRYPQRAVLGHPFNPPHLIPLIEVVGGAATSEATVDAAMAFYRQIGKHPIRLKREMKGHVANRLQAALWQEAFHLLAEGVADIADIDAAISHGPGLRWGAARPVPEPAPLRRTRRHGTHAGPSRPADRGDVAGPRPRGADPGTGRATRPPHGRARRIPADGGDGGPA